MIDMVKSRSNTEVSDAAPGGPAWDEGLDLITQVAQDTTPARAIHALSI